MRHVIRTDSPSTSQKRHPSPSPQNMDISPALVMTGVKWPYIPGHNTGGASKQIM